MWSPRFDKRRPQRRPQRLLEEPPNVTRKMRGLDSGANGRSDDREALGFSILLAPRSCRQRRSAQDGSATSWSDFGTETSARRAPERLAAKRMTLARSTIRRSVLVLRIQCSSVSFSSVESFISGAGRLIRPTLQLLRYHTQATTRVEQGSRPASCTC